MKTLLQKKKKMVSPGEAKIIKEKAGEEGQQERKEAGMQEEDCRAMM